MNWANLGFVLLGASLPILFLLLVASRKAGWKRPAAHLACYAIDMAMALTGFVLGFGLEIKSVFWVVFPMLVGRFAFHVLTSSMTKAWTAEAKS